MTGIAKPLLTFFLGLGLGISGLLSAQIVNRSIHTMPIANLQPSLEIRVATLERKVAADELAFAKHTHTVGVTGFHGFMALSAVAPNALAPGVSGGIYVLGGDANGPFINELKTTSTPVIGK